MEDIKQLIKAGQFKEAGKLLAETRARPGCEMDVEMLGLLHQAGMAAGKRTGLISAREIRILPTPLVYRYPEVYAVAITPDGQRAVSATHGGMIYVWDIDSGEKVREYDVYQLAIRGIALGSDGRRLVSAGWDGTLGIWDLESDECLGRPEEPFKAGLSVLAMLPGPSGSPRPPIFAVALTPDCLQAVSGGESKTVNLWDLNEQVCLKQFKGHSEAIFDVKIARDGTTCASCGEDGLYLWDIQGDENQMPVHYDIGSAEAIAFTPDGQEIVAAGSDSMVRVIDLKDGQQFDLAGHSQRVFPVVVTSDGRFAITGSQDDTIRVWDLLLEESIYCIYSHQGPVLSLSLSKDDRRLVSGGSDRTTRAFELDWDYQF